MAGIRQVPPLHKPKIKRGSKMPLLLISRLLLTNTLLNNNGITIKNDQHCNDTYLIEETEKVSEVRITTGGFRVQSFWPNEHGIALQSCTKPLGRGQEAPQGEHEVDRTHKQWNLRNAGFKNVQLEENRHPMKLLKRSVQLNELLSLENARKKAQMENILQSQKSQSSQQNLREHFMEIEEQEPQKIQILGKRIKKKCYYCNSERHLYKNILKVQNFKKQY